jgi:hypothetical protein
MSGNSSDAYGKLVQVPSSGGALRAFNQGGYLVIADTGCGSFIRVFFDFA